MGNITCAAELKIAIQGLEFEQTIQGQFLKEQLFVTIDSLRPINLIKGALSEITSSPNIIENVLGSVLGLITGSISKKIAIGASQNLLRKMMGSVLQFGVTNVVSQHSNLLKTMGNLILQQLFHKNHTNKAKT